MSIAALLVAIAPPVWVALRCYDAAADGERAGAEVVSEHAEIGAVLRVVSGSHRGEACSVRASGVNLEQIAAGDVLRVVLSRGRPGEGVLVATVRNSAALLWTLGGLTAAFVLLILLVARVLVRSLTRVPTLTGRLDLEPGGLRCPRCQLSMEEGYLPLLAGIHWRAPGEPIGLPHAFGGLPGTVGWLARPCLHAARCPSCALVLFGHGGD